MSQDIKSYKRIIKDGVPHYGQHVMLTAVHCNSHILDFISIDNFITSLVKDIDMVAHGKPLIARFGVGEEVGISAVQLIETSAITIHTNDKFRDLYLDVFSCKEYEAGLVWAVVERFFNPISISYEEVFRK